MKTKYVLRSEVTDLDEIESVLYLKNSLMQDEMAGVIFFCSDRYDLDKLATEFNQSFDCPIIGCTTAGEIGSTYQSNGIVAVSFSAKAFSFHPITLYDLDSFDAAKAAQVCASLESQLTFSSELNSKKMFAFLLIDGLSKMEEHTVASLGHALGGVSIVGGSAGDSLTFTKTSVFSDGEFRSSTAVLCLIESKLAFQTFKTQHYTPSDKEMVITAAAPEKRIVYEIDGGPAATELANIIGISKQELTLEVYSTHPVMLQIGDDWYVRSIRNYHDDDSLSFACAIDAGLPLTVGECEDLIKSLSTKVDSLIGLFSSIEVTLGCDCIHRRLEIMETGLQDKVEAVLEPLNFVGFSTYGEQYNSVHVNQTLTGVVIGGELNGN
jgi:hypothetical protein